MKVLGLIFEYCLVCSVGFTQAGTAPRSVGDPGTAPATDLAVSVAAPPYSADSTGAQSASAAFQSAIWSLGTAGGTVFAPCGTYKMTSTVRKPRNVRLVGCGTDTGTTLVWPAPGGGPMFVEGDGAGIVTPAGDPAQIPSGFENLTLKGPGSSGTVDGVFRGGDPNGVISPPTWKDNRTVWRSLVIEGFRDAEVFGNNVYGSARYNVFFTSNADDIHTLRGNDGGPIPDLSYGGLHSRASHATILAEGSGGVFRWFGTGMEYSSPIINASNNLFEFHGSQLEKAGLVDSGINGPFFRNTAATDSIGIVIIGGNIVFSDPSGTDADMIDLRVGGSANVIISGTRVSSRHSVTSLLLAKFGNPGVSSIDVSVVNDGANVGPPSSNCLNTSYQTAGATGYSRTMPAVFLDSGGPSGTAPSPVILRMRAQSAPVEFGTFWDGGAGAWGERFSGATVWALRADQSGRVGVNRSSPSNTYFGVEGLPTYSNNAGARAAGLVPGDCYLVTDSDPRQLAVVF